MSIPGFIRILGIDYEVEENDTLGMFEQPGVANCPHHKIIIDEVQPKEAKISTLLHEFIEVINYQLQLGLKHRQITALGTSFYQLLSDNPSFLEILLDDEDIEVEE